MKFSINSKFMCTIAIVISTVLIFSCSTKQPLHLILNKDVLSVGVAMASTRIETDEYKLVALSSIEKQIQVTPFLQSSRNIKLVNRDQLGKVVDEILFQDSSGVFSDEEKRELQALGMDILVVFQILDVKTKDDKYEGHHELCVQKKTYVSMRISVIRIDNGESLISDLYDDVYDERQCAVSRYPMEKFEFKRYYVSKVIKHISKHFISDFNNLL